MLVRYLSIAAFVLWLAPASAQLTGNKFLEDSESAYWLG
jgi:hypothetical protein